MHGSIRRVVACKVGYPEHKALLLPSRKVQQYQFTGLLHHLPSHHLAGRWVTLQPAPGERKGVSQTLQRARSPKGPWYSLMQGKGSAPGESPAASAHSLQGGGGERSLGPDSLSCTNNLVEITTGCLQLAIGQECM